MDAIQGNKFWLFLLLFVPGFISLKVYDLIIPGERRDTSKSIFDVATYSIFNYAFLSPVIGFVLYYKLYAIHFFLFLVISFVVVFVVPTFWPFLMIYAPRWRWLRILPFLHPVQKPWDYVLGNGEQYWVIVHLKDGERIGGVYGPKSFASSYPVQEQIYLEKAWKLDAEGRFLNQIERTSGIIILADDIRSVELFEG